LATSGVDKRVKVFDLRTKKLLNASHVPMGASSLAFSQRGLLAAGLGNRVQVRVFISLIFYFLRFERMLCSLAFCFAVQNWF
jgi:hypothetical protein